MRAPRRRTLLWLLSVYLVLVAVPLVLHFAAGQGGASAAPTPAPTATPAPSTAGSFRIYDTERDALLLVADEDFLRGALPCEMTLAAPEEALKAQAVACYTVYSRLREQNAGSAYDFTCNSAAGKVYRTDADSAAVFGDGWAAAKAQLDAIAEAVAGEVLLYDGALAETTYFAISAGCTQPSENVWAGAKIPYLEAVACPFDLLYDGCKESVTITADTVKSAFPEVAFTADIDSWFGDIEYHENGYVKTVRLCGTAVSGNAVREALALRSASFTVARNETGFTFTTLGWGHGVGMSQAAALYLAETGADYKTILAYFYKGTTLGVR